MSREIGGILIAGNIVFAIPTTSFLMKWKSAPWIEGQTTLHTLKEKGYFSSREYPQNDKSFWQNKPHSFT